MPVVRTDGRSVARSVGHVITKFSRMVRFIYPWCSAGALRARSSAITSFTFTRSIVVFFFFYLSVNEVAKAGLDKWPCWRSVLSDHQSVAIYTYKKNNVHLKQSRGRRYYCCCGTQCHNYYRQLRSAIFVKNLETLVCVSPFPVLIWVLQWSQSFKIRVA